MFKIQIETANDAFVDDPRSEIVRILRDVADKMETGRFLNRLYDANGNAVGSVIWERVDPSA